MADFIHWGGLKSSESGGGAGLVDLMFPIGSVITNSRASFDPNTLYEGTTWQRIKGRVIVGVDENDSSFNTTGKTGGHKELQSHTHSGDTSSAGRHYHSGTTYGSPLNEDPIHDHRTSFVRCSTEGSGYGLTQTAGFKDRVLIDSNTRINYTAKSGSHEHNLDIDYGGSHTHSFTTSSAGSGNAGNLQPYITKYVWERIA